MKKRVNGRDHNQIINNFYSLVTIIIMAAVMVVYTKYIQPNQKKTFSALILPCQNELQIKQKVTNPAFLKEALMLFNQGNYMLNGGLILEENSKLENAFFLKQIDEIFENSSEVVAIKNAQKFLNIKYEIIEKNKTNKNMVDFLVSFRISANEVFRMYTYFNISNSNEISKKVECIMNSFKANAAR